MTTREQPPLSTTLVAFENHVVRAFRGRTADNCYARCDCGWQSRTRIGDESVVRKYAEAHVAAVRDARS